jgi:hypothetical protein
MEINAIRDSLLASLDEFEDRHYLGMSAISQCPRKLYMEMVNGKSKPDLPSAQMFHEGYLHEADIIERLIKQGVPITNRQRELVAPFDPRLRGHVDGEVDGDLLEVKSVNARRFNEVRMNGTFSEHIAQAQLYMRYGVYSRAIIIYKSRETDKSLDVNAGNVWVEAFYHVESDSARLEEKARMILAAVDDRVPLHAPAVIVVGDACLGPMCPEPAGGP